MVTPKNLDHNGDSVRFFVRSGSWDRRAYGNRGNKVREMFWNPTTDIIVATFPETSYGKLQATIYTCPNNR